MEGFSQVLLEVDNIIATQGVEQRMNVRVGQNG